MTRAILDLAEFHRRLPGIGKRLKAGVRLSPSAGLAPAGKEERVVSFVFSDASIDRYGDTIDAKGWIFDKSGAGTVALFGHDSSSVENVVGRAHNVRVQGDRLLGDIHFAAPEENPNAEIVYQMVKGGFLNAVSVGFQPIDWTQTKDKTRPGGIDFKKQELLEISIVPIPANPQAVALAKAAGIAVDRLGPVFAAPVTVTKRGLYAVSSLAMILAELGWLASDAAWEAEYEGDGSEVPEMLAEALRQLGEALVAMTVEEVGELLGREDGEGETVIAMASAGQRALFALAQAARGGTEDDTLSGKVDRLTAMVESRLGGPVADPEAKAGKVLSAATKKTLGEAYVSILKGCEVIKGMVDEPADPDEDGEAKALRARRAAAMRLSLENHMIP